jgi:hypothetical protein
MASLLHWPGSFTKEKPPENCFGGLSGQILACGFLDPGDVMRFFRAWWVALLLAHIESFARRGDTCCVSPSSFSTPEPSFHLYEKLEYNCLFGSTAPDKGHHPVRAIRWNERYLEIIEFKQKFGHLSVPKGWLLNSALATWVSTPLFTRVDNDAWNCLRSSIVYVH